MASEPDGSNHVTFSSLPFRMAANGRRSQDSGEEVEVLSLISYIDMGLNDVCANPCTEVDFTLTISG